MTTGTLLCTSKPPTSRAPQPPSGSRTPEAERATTGRTGVPFPSLQANPGSFRTVFAEEHIYKEKQMQDKTIGVTFSLVCDCHLGIAAMANLAFCILVAFIGQLTEARRIPLQFATDVKSITWENCDSGKLPGVIKSLSITPDPVSIPGDVTVSVVLNTEVALSSPLQIKITAEKELLGEWLTVPCIDQFGTCTYNDVCSLLDSFFKPGQQCPGPLATYGLPCHCPFKAGSYSLPTTSFKIPNLSLPSWMADGSYRVTGILTHKDKEIGCAKFTFSLSSTSSWWW